MIKHKTKSISIWRSTRNAELLQSIDLAIEEMLTEINNNGHIFLDLNTTALINDLNYEYSSQIIITIVYREIPKREVLIEKIKK